MRPDVYPTYGSFGMLSVLSWRQGYGETYGRLGTIQKFLCIGPLHDRKSLLPPPIIMHLINQPHNPVPDLVLRFLEGFHQVPVRCE